MESVQRNFLPCHIGNYSKLCPKQHEIYAPSSILINQVCNGNYRRKQGRSGTLFQKALRRCVWLFTSSTDVDCKASIPTRIYLVHLFSRNQLMHFDKARWGKKLVLTCACWNHVHKCKKHQELTIVERVSLKLLCLDPQVYQVAWLKCHSLHRSKAIGGNNGVSALYITKLVVDKVSIRHAGKRCPLTWCILSRPRAGATEPRVLKEQAEIPRWKNENTSQFDRFANRKFRPSRFIGATNIHCLSKVLCYSQVGVDIGWYVDDEVQNFFRKWLIHDQELLMTRIFVKEQETRMVDWRSTNLEGRVE